MTEHRYFPNQQFIDKARTRLQGRPSIYWLIGSSCSGKSTIARALAEQTGIAVYDMDERVFGGYRFQPHRHPATTAWFTADNPLAFMLSLSWEEFDSLYRAANAEYLDLLADDLAINDGQSYIIDGGMTHPLLLAQALPASQIVCLAAPDELRSRIWETAADRAPMRDSVLALPDGPAMWRKFLWFDEMMAATLTRDSLVGGIKVVERTRLATPAETTAMVLDQFGIK